MFQTSIATLGLVSLITSGLDADQQGHVEIRSQGEGCFVLGTGPYSVALQPGTNALRISRRDTSPAGASLMLIPGGDDPKLAVLDPSNIKHVECRKTEDGVRATVTGVLDWCRYTFTLFLPVDTPGLINSRIELEVTRSIGPEEKLFEGTHPELRFTDPAASDPAWLASRLVYYFNSTPGAATYHTVAPESPAIPDLNQFVFYGDPHDLRSTLHYYVDFTSMSRFFRDSSTRILGSVQQPPGCLNASATDFPGTHSAFGFDLPEVKTPLQEGTSLVLVNSFLFLAPGAPLIGEPPVYGKRFCEGVSAMYPYIENPAHAFVDWPAIAELGLDDLVANEEASGRPAIGPQTNLSSCHRYAERFGSAGARELIAEGDTIWSKVQMKLPYGDAWQYLYPLIQAGEYAREFGSPSARRVFLDAAPDAVEVGRKLQYIFPLRINADFSRPEGIWYEYDCTGAYVYLMLLYHETTGETVYLGEARKAGDRLLAIGFEYPYEFTTTSLGPVAMLRLFKATGDARYLEGYWIPFAAVLRHSWLFNPGYREYCGRTIFMLTEGMPAVYANGWEEGALLHYLHRFLIEGRGIVPEFVTQMTCEVLRWKGVSLADSLAPLLPDPSIIYDGIPREWSMPVNKAWHIPLEGFGYLEWDDSGLHDRPGRVSQGPYCFGALPEAANLLFHPLEEGAQLYVEVPVVVTVRDAGGFEVEVLGTGESYAARIRAGSWGGQAKPVVRPVHDSPDTSEVELHRVPSSEWWGFRLEGEKRYSVDLH